MPPSHIYFSTIEWRYCTLLIHNAEKIDGYCSLSLCVTLSSSPAAVAPGLFLFFSLFLAFPFLCMWPVAWACCTSTSLSFQRIIFFIHSFPSIFEKRDCALESSRMFFTPICFYQMLFASCFCRVSVNTGWNVCISYSFWEMPCFCSYSRCCAGLKASSGLGHLNFTCCVDKSCLSMQTSFVREEQRRVSIWFLQDLTPDQP